jgi:hypothetical protein
VPVVRRLGRMPIRRNRSTPAAEEKTETQRRSPSWGQPTLGGHGGRQTALATKADCKCTFASHGTAEHATPQA